MVDCRASIAMLLAVLSARQLPCQQDRVVDRRVVKVAAVEGSYSKLSGFDVRLSQVKGEDGTGQQREGAAIRVHARKVLNKYKDKHKHMQSRNFVIFERCYRCWAIGGIAGLWVISKAASSFQRRVVDSQCSPSRSQAF
jgi:hypothetical protein